MFVYRKHSSEAEEQRMLFRWAEMEKGKHPELALLFHIPNGGRRDPREAKILVAEGVRAGVPDLFLPVPSGIYHGLFIEMKRENGGRVSENQSMWLMELTHNGYFAAVCHGFDDARMTIINYLSGELKNEHLSSRAD